MRISNPKLASLSGKSLSILTSVNMISLRSASPNLQKCCNISHLRKRKSSSIDYPNSCSNQKPLHFQSSSFSSDSLKSRRIEELMHRVGPVLTRRITITQTTSLNLAHQQIQLDNQSKEEARLTDSPITLEEIMRREQDMTQTTKPFTWKKKK